MENHLEIQGNISCFNLDCDNAIKKFHAFCEIWHKDTNPSLIIRALLTIGDYSIITHEYTALGVARYFGCDGGWNRILTTVNKDEKNKVSDILDKFLSSYLISTGDKTDEKLNFLINKFLQDNSSSVNKDWRYYFIKYKDITSETYGKFNLFTWNDNNGFDINNMGNSGKSPLLSYHINPYIYVLSEKLNIPPNLGRYSYKISNLSIKTNIKIFSKSKGWRIELKEDFSISESLLEKYEIENEDDSFILKEKNDKDRIETACDFIKDYLNEN